MDYSKIIDIEKLRLIDCISMYEKEGTTFEINNGRITNLYEDGELL